MAAKRTAIEPGSAKSITISLPSPQLSPSTASSGNIRSVGSRSPRVMTWRLWPRLLPVRRKNGTPAHRQLSTSVRSAMNVSVCEPRATPGSFR